LLLAVVVETRVAVDILVEEVAVVLFNKAVF
jgi:hypothetical protein